MTTFRITPNVIGGATLLETDDGREAYAFCLTQAESRLYRDGQNVAILRGTPTGIEWRSRYQTLAALFAEGE